MMKTIKNECWGRFGFPKEGETKRDPANTLLLFFPGHAPSPVLVSVGRMPSSGASASVPVSYCSRNSLASFINLLLSLCEVPRQTSGHTPSGLFVPLHISSDNTFTNSFPFGVIRGHIFGFRSRHGRIFSPAKTYTLFNFSNSGLN